MTKSLETQLVQLKASATRLAQLSRAEKDSVLRQLADLLIRQEKKLLEANALDLDDLDAGRPAAFRDRLTLTPQRIEQMSKSLHAVADLFDPVGELVDERELENGLIARRIRAPLGPIFMIFESRPNVITETFSLAFKSGNPIALRGGSESQATAACLYDMIATVLPRDLNCFVGLQDYDRALVNRLLKRSDVFDVCVPRGGDALIELVTQESKMPVIKNDRGLCHLYVHADADRKMAEEVLINAKTQRPGVCNAVETLLIDQAWGRDASRVLIQSLRHRHVELRMSEEALRFLGLEGEAQNISEDAATSSESESAKLSTKSSIRRARPEDFDTEHLDLILNVHIVENLDSALEHIARHGSRHSECIITKNQAAARRFQNAVDAACVYWNASTRFTDGYQLGLGGELGISTQKLHVRGPVGLRELTSVRWVIDGQGQVRP
jgi:glutamate-5-semialdehyde dehydrogenase